MNCIYKIVHRESDSFPWATLADCLHDLSKILHPKRKWTCHKPTLLIGDRTRYGAKYLASGMENERTKRNVM